MLCMRLQSPRVSSGGWCRRFRAGRLETRWKRPAEARRKVRPIRTRCSTPGTTASPSRGASRRSTSQLERLGERHTAPPTPTPLPPSRVHPAAFAYEDNAASRAHPAGGRRKSPPTPANPRNASVEKARSQRESPPIPAHPGITKTGLSRRRSRVRVPSLP